mmetsp:Transcript_14727/g.27973  ORF Transcript_14727/g.27973 Transcript_14727/m.27973 type:complete len:350 (+) Transcript_14727:38-1087(+)|eukprot:scaffold3337_cov169-Amphora_coffeaeformis.AAC.6
MMIPLGVKRYDREKKLSSETLPSKGFTWFLLLTLLVAIGSVGHHGIPDLSKMADGSFRSPSSEIPPSSSSTTSSRRMKYFENYRYVPAQSRYDYNPYPAPDCGQAPDYPEFFALPTIKRSANNEDRVIYETLFKSHNVVGPINGSVVELGAFNGVQESNSHFFEQCLGWKSLLIEGNPMNYQGVLSNRPFAEKMSFAPSCDSDYERVNKTVEFYRYPITNVGLVGYAKTYETKPTVPVPCGPLSPVLEDIFEGRPVNFFSLDVEGAEMLVLNTIDFQKVQIHVMMIEIENNHCKRNECVVRQQVRAKMAKEGYLMYQRLVPKSDVYVHPNSPFQVPNSVAQPVVYQPGA